MSEIEPFIPEIVFGYDQTTKSRRIVPHPEEWTKMLHYAGISDFWAAKTKFVFLPDAEMDDNKGVFRQEVHDDKLYNIVEINADLVIKKGNSLLNDISRHELEHEENSLSGNKSYYYSYSFQRRFRRIENAIVLSAPTIAVALAILHIIPPMVGLGIAAFIYSAKLSEFLVTTADGVDNGYFAYFFDPSERNARRAVRRMKRDGIRFNLVTIEKNK